MANRPYIEFNNCQNCQVVVMPTEPPRKPKGALLQRLLLKVVLWVIALFARPDLR